MITKTDKTLNICNNNNVILLINNYTTKLIIAL